MSDEYLNNTEQSEIVDDNINKYLSLSLGGEDYGISILQVREILVMVDITPLPQAADYVRGVINLRGRIIPVVDMRGIFGMQSSDYTDETCVIVVEVNNGDNEECCQMGTIVDKVNEVVNIENKNIDPVPNFGEACNMSCLKGMGKTDTGVVIILDIDKVLAYEDVGAYQDKSNSEAGNGQQRAA